MEMVVDKIKMEKYAAYKDSGVAWVGEIPSGWEILPGLSFIFENKDRNKGMIRNTVLSLSYGKIRVKQEDELTGLVPESFETYQFVNTGDLIFRPTDLQNDIVSLRSSISEYDGIITNAYLNLRFKPKANAKFFHYFFRAIDNNKIIYGLGSGLRQNISYLDFRRFQFPFPPLPEQTAIAAFLDRKTILIDQAIGIKQKQIELLKERRQILIHKAVTRGLNPNVQLKDSGVEWIGEVPVDWEVKRLASFGNFSKGGGFSKSDLTESGVSAILYGDIYTKYEIEIKRGVRFISNETAKKSIEIKKGNLLFTGSGETMEDIGKCVVFSSDETTVAGGDVIIFDQNQNDNLFLSYVLNTEGAKFEKAKYSKGEIIVHTYGSKLRNIYIPIPSLEEQIVIAAFIEKGSSKIATSISLKEQEMEKLKEYKGALINSAVTGKIKV